MTVTRPPLNLPAVRALARRDVRLYFSNPSGYVFVTLFIFLSAAAAFWQRRFFLNNLANLDQLNNYFPYLLLLFVPALTMGVWADERRQGTDELLLTLPASDLDVVAGKYLATVGVYSVSVFLSLSHVVVLVWLGHPDPGLMVANYLGYWLAGAALIAVGMLASLLTANVTVAFVLGALFCAIPVLAPTAAALFSERLGALAAPLSVNVHFADFARGVISLGGLGYFFSLAAFFLYLNVTLLGRRHWPRLRPGPPYSAHVVVRAAALVVALVAANALMSRVPARVDATAERLHSLSPETRKLLSEVPAERPVFIQAFVSPDVPQLYVQARENLLSVLREVDSRSQSRVQVLITETAPYSAEARTARERYGITPVAVRDPNDPQSGADGIFLAVALTSGAEEQVIPFIDRGLSPEYEIARAMRVVARSGRKRVGVVMTDVPVLGGLDPATRRPTQAWKIADELTKQYEVVPLSPSQPITERVDAMLVPLPSTLLQYEMDNVKAAVLGGTPALIVVDPAFSADMRLSPAAPMFERVNPYRRREMVLLKNYGDIQKMMAEVGITWPPARIVWDSYTPHPDMLQLPREVVFVGAGSGSSRPFSPTDPATAGLQEVMALYAGRLAVSDPEQFTFEPLLRTGPASGTVSYFQLLVPQPEGAVVNTELLHEPSADKEEYVLAAHVRSKTAAHEVNAIVVADLDFISDQFFDIRAQGASNATFDNVSFFLNSVDVLAGDEAFVGLRRRRVRHRTLERVEAQTRAFVEQRAAGERQAEQDARKALADAEARQKTRVDEIRGRTDLDVQAKGIMARNVEETERRKLEVLAANIELAKQAKVQASRESMESQVQRIQGTIRTIAVAAPPVPVFALGVLIFLRRRRRERESAAAARRLRSVA
jgi:ABC-2 type transport system permease protein